MKTGTVDFWPNGGYNQTGCPPMNLEVLLTDSSEFFLFYLLSFFSIFFL